MYYWQDGMIASGGVNWTLILSILGGGGVMGIVLLIFRVGEWKGTLSQTVNRLEKDAETERPRTQDDAEWKGGVNSLLERIREDLDELRRIVFAKFGIPLVSSQSPLQLTKLGKTVSQEIGARKWVERVADGLSSQTEASDAYEIQTFCFEYVERLDQYLDEERRAIRQTAFQRGLKAKEVRRVLAIELRDELLERAGLDAPKAPDEED